MKRIVGMCGKERLGFVFIVPSCMQYVVPVPERERWNEAPLFHHFYGLYQVFVDMKHSSKENWLAKEMEQNLNSCFTLDFSNVLCGWAMNDWS